MKKIFAVMALLALLPQAQAAAGTEVKNPFAGAQYKCDPSVLTLSYVRRSGLEDGLHFEGTLETPTPGYSYNFTMPALQTDGVHVTLSITAPDGMVIQVIDKLTIDTIIPLGNPPTTVYVDMEDPVKWGFGRITCNIVG